MPRSQEIEDREKERVLTDDPAIGDTLQTPLGQALRHAYDLVSGQIGWGPGRCVVNVGTDQCFIAVYHVEIPGYCTGNLWEI